MRAWDAGCVGVPLWWPGMLDLAQSIEVCEYVAERECCCERGYVLSYVCVNISK